MKFTLLFTVITFVGACSSSASTNNSTSTNEFEVTLIERNWVLTHFQGNDGNTLTFDNESASQFTISFSSVMGADGRVTRSASGIIVCNDYRGTYALEGSILSLSEMIATEIDCGGSSEPPAALFERVLFNDNNALMLSLEEDRLEIASASNEKLIFSDDISTADSSNESWVLVSYGIESGDTVLAVENSPFSLTFNFNDQDQTTGYAGFDGCNVFGSYDVMLEGDSIIPVNGVSVDGAFCDNLQFSEYLQQFDHFYSVISNTFVRSEMSGRLTLNSASGKSLIFVSCEPIDPSSLDSTCEPTSDSVEFTELRSGDLASLGNSTFSQPRYQVFRDQ